MEPARPQTPRTESPVQVWGAAPTTGAASFFFEAGNYLLRFHGIADFVLSADGAEVHCHPALDAVVPWEQVYRQQVLPLQRVQQGHAVYHGGAVSRDDHAVVLLGMSGQGKSTLTAACAARGMPFLTDDCLLLREDVAAIAVLPDEDHVRLWDDSYEALTGAPPETQRTAWPKPRLQAHVELLPHRTVPAALACMLVLDGEEPGVVLERLSPADAALVWCANAFVVDQRSPQVLRNRLQRGARLAQAVPAFRLAYPRDYARLPEVVGAVSACLDAVLAEKAA